MSETSNATKKTTNYSAEMLAQVLAMYAEVGTEGIPEIAQKFNKTERSIRSKLVKEGVYVPIEKQAKLKSEGPSKKQLLREIEAFGFKVDGLEGATKEALARVKQLFYKQ